LCSLPHATEQVRQIRDLLRLSLYADSDVTARETSLVDEGTASRYGWKARESDPGAGEVSRPTLGPTQYPVQWILGLYRG
jgi:hypothetical protein